MNNGVKALIRILWFWWLVMVSLGEKSMGSYINFYFIYKNGRVLGHVGRSLSWITSHQSINFQTSASWRPITPWIKERLDLSTLQKFILLIFLSTFPKGTFIFLLRWLCFGKKKIISLSWNFWAHALFYLVAQSCLTLCNPIDCSPPGSLLHGVF